MSPLITELRPPRRPTRDPRDRCRRRTGHSGTARPPGRITPISAIHIGLFTRSQSLSELSASLFLFSGKNPGTNFSLRNVFLMRRVLCHGHLTPGSSRWYESCGPHSAQSRGAGLLVSSIGRGQRASCLLDLGIAPRNDPRPGGKGGDAEAHGRETALSLQPMVRQPL